MAPDEKAIQLTRDVRLNKASPGGLQRSPRHDIDVESTGLGTPLSERFAQETTNAVARRCMAKAPLR